VMLLLSLAASASRVTSTAATAAAAKEGTATYQPPDRVTSAWH
jgi:hypothetical protein